MDLQEFCTGSRQWNDFIPYPFGKKAFTFKVFE